MSDDAAAYLAGRQDVANLLRAREATIEAQAAEIERLQKLVERLQPRRPDVTASSPMTRVAPMRWPKGGNKNAR